MVLEVEEEDEGLSGTPRHARACRGGDPSQQLLRRGVVGAERRVGCLRGDRRWRKGEGAAEEEHRHDEGAQDEAVPREPGVLGEGAIPRELRKGAARLQGVVATRLLSPEESEQGGSVGGIMMNCLADLYVEVTLPDLIPGRICCTASYSQYAVRIGCAQLREELVCLFLNPADPFE